MAQNEVQSQTAAATIFPIGIVGTGCPMYTPTGELTTNYSTAQQENNTFPFADPLPSDAVITSVTVQVYALGRCLPSNSLEIRINPGVAGVSSSDSIVGTRQPQEAINSCTAPQFFAPYGVARSMITPAVLPYVRGGTNTIQVTELPDGACNDVRIERVVVTLNCYTNIPRVTFDVTAASPDADKSVIMHKIRNDFPYLSSYQDTAGPDPIYGRDNRVLVTGTVTDANGAALPNQVLYVRTGDPPDPASYVPPTESHHNDNGGNRYCGFAFLGPTDAMGWNRITSDSNGRFALTMGMDPQFAGNNQEVEAAAAYLAFDNSWQDRCAAAIGCYRSGVFTAWRRMFLENDFMFKHGTFIRANTAVGSTAVPVVSKTDFTNATPNAPVHAVLMHTGDVPTDSYYEEVNVVGTGGNRNSPTLLLQTATRHAYGVVMSGTDSTLRIGDAVGKFTSPGDLWGLQTYLIPNFFASMSTEMKTLGSPVDSSSGNPAQNPLPFVPFVATCPSSNYCAELAARSFDNRDSNDANPNHILIVAVNDISGSATSGTLAETMLHRSETNWVYTGPQVILMYNVPLTNAYGANIAGFAEATTHEAVHMFDVNPPAYPLGGHCPSTTLGVDGLHCLMTPGTARSPAERTDGLISLHNNPWTTSEYRRVRRQLSDPVSFSNQTSSTPIY